MGTCETCGNTYERTFDVRMADGTAHTFDSFECAAHGVAPRCAHCGCTVLGHGVEHSGHIYCCDNCGRQAGELSQPD